VALAQHLRVKTTVKTCAYAKTLLMLTPADAATLEEWMGNPTITATAIADGLRDNKTGYVGESVIREHRRGACVCAR